MDMDTLWNKIREGAALSVEKIEEYTRMGKLKLDEMGTRKKIDRNFIDIGERVYELIEEGKTESMQDDLAVRRAIENIKELKAEIDSINKEMDETTLRDEETPASDDSDDQEEEETTGV